MNRESVIVKLSQLHEMVSCTAFRHDDIFFIFDKDVIHYMPINWCVEHDGSLFGKPVKCSTYALPPSSPIEIDGVRFWGPSVIDDLNSLVYKVEDFEIRKVLGKKDKGVRVVKILSYINNHEYSSIISSRLIHKEECNIIEYYEPIFKYKDIWRISKRHSFTLKELFVNGELNDNYEIRKQILNIEKINSIKNKHGSKKVFDDFLNRDKLKYRNDDLINTNFLAYLLKNGITL